MNLLTTNLNQEQADLVFYLNIFADLVTFLKKPLQVEVTGGDGDEIIVDGLHFFKDVAGEYGAACGWICGYMKQTGSGYWEPPDYDFVQVSQQLTIEHLSKFVGRTVAALLTEYFENNLSCEAEIDFVAQMKTFEFEPMF